jgi:uncharacterized protein (DUF736 family)
MGFNIGSFKKTDTGFTGRITTLLHNIQVDFHRVLDRTNENLPAFEAFVGELKIGAAWERKKRNGNGTYLSVSLEDPTFSSGFYTLVKSGVEHGYTLYFERPRPKKDNDTAGRQAA